MSTVIFVATASTMWPRCVGRQRRASELAGLRGGWGLDDSTMRTVTGKTRDLSSPPGQKRALNCPQYQGEGTHRVASAPALRGYVWQGIHEGGNGRQLVFFAAQGRSQVCVRTPSISFFVESFVEGDQLIFLSTPTR